MVISDLIGKTVQVYDYQTTYLILRVDEELIRINLKNKMEFHLQRGTVGTLQILQTHPLLINYNENFITTYINSKPDKVEAFIQDLEICIHQITNTWRSWESYITDTNTNFTKKHFIDNINRGSGLLLKAPYSINQEVINVCNQHGVETISFGNEVLLNRYKILFISDDYVISKEFKNQG